TPPEPHSLPYTTLFRSNTVLENNNAVIITGGPTTLSVAALAGATNIRVASTSGFKADTTITIENESAQVLTVGTSGASGSGITRSEEHTSELQSRVDLV